MSSLPDFFGINLGHDSLKTVKIKQVGNKAKIDSIAKMPVVQGLLENDSEEGVKILAKEIAKAVKSTNLTTKSCVISVPEVAVFSRLINLPEVADSEVNEAIHYALKPLVPIPLENVNVSFLEINKQEIDGKKHVNWYVVAAPKQLISRLQIIVESAGLELLAVETEALAIARMIQYNYSIAENTDTMLLDMGAESTNLILSRNGVVIFSQNIGTGSESLTKVIAADFGLDFQLAEKYKVAYGLDPVAGEGKILKSVEPIMQIMLSEIQRTLAYYKDKINGPGISRIFITGGGAHLPSIAPYISEKLSIPAEVVNPFNNFILDQKDAANLNNLSPNSFNVAIGLALKGIL